MQPLDIFKFQIQNIDRSYLILTQYFFFVIVAYSVDFILSCFFLKQ